MLILNQQIRSFSVSKMVFKIFLLSVVSFCCFSTSFADFEAIPCTGEVTTLLQNELLRIDGTSMHNAYVKVELISLFETPSDGFTGGSLKYSTGASWVEHPSDIVIIKQMFYSKTQGCFITEDLK